MSDGRRALRSGELRRPNDNTADLLALLVAADTLRRDLVGNIVSYVVNRNINFTNICFVGCKFCAFSRGPREADSYFHSLEDMGRKAKEAWELGATEVCIQGGCRTACRRFITATFCAP
jgi:2-iminoacetate synthase ThiH